jgi:hypothetical protein
MPNHKSILPALLILLGGSLPALAQVTPRDSLSGKKVHVYLPADDVDTLIVRNWNFPMTKSGYWHSATLRGGPFDSNQGFFFSTKVSTPFLSVEGWGPTERTRFHLADFQGKQEMWIIIDPSGPIGAKPTVLLEPPKVVNILNPWHTTAPRLVRAGGNKSMVTLPNRCGWFMAFLLQPADL